jgi:predicted AAA+ superfamily ATPase
MYVDSHREESGAFWLTGSQKFSLMRDVKESLAGRVAIIDMLGFSRKEALQKPFESEPLWTSMDTMHRQAEKLTALGVPLHRFIIGAWRLTSSASEAF